MIINWFIVKFGNKRDNRDRAFSLLSFLKSGDSRAFFLSCKKIPVESDRLNIAVSEGARVSPPVLKSLDGILSSPSSLVLVNFSEKCKDVINGDFTKAERPASLLYVG